MVMRVCDGTDENLTRQVPDAEFDPAVMTVSEPWAATAWPGCVVICCQCRMRFDDDDRLVTWPHENFRARKITLADWAAANPQATPPNAREMP